MCIELSRRDFFRLILLNSCMIWAEFLAIKSAQFPEHPACYTHIRGETFSGEKIGLTWEIGSL